jgi:CheY-like chemotaxis protein
VGLRILEYIKAHLPETKVLVMTSADANEVRAECYAVGADEFLNKPFDTELLISTMRRMVPHLLDLA